MIRRYRRMKRALHEIGTICTNTTAPERMSCRMSASGRVRGSGFGATDWCDACIAWDGLYGTRAEVTGGDRDA